LRQQSTVILPAVVLLLAACRSLGPAPNLTVEEENPSGETKIYDEQPESEFAESPSPEPTKEKQSFLLAEKIANRPTIPVFYPWSSNCGQSLWFDCDLLETPYSLIWTSAGIVPDIASTRTEVSREQQEMMRSDPDTLFLINEEWHYWNLAWRTLSPDSDFFLDEIFGSHVDSEYGETRVINFEHPDWPSLLAEKAGSFQQAGFDGMMLDWWHNGAGNGRSEEAVQAARMAIAIAVREQVGEEFILMGNVNWSMDDPTAQYMSGVFLELWKSDQAAEYSLTYEDEDSAAWNPSIERMEDLLLYWNANLGWPKIIAFEPWKITTGDYVADRSSPRNLQYARLFTAMAVVIPDHGYMLYADNNDDWDGGDHQHAYYDFFLTDLGSPISDRIEVVDGVSYKEFENGLIAYNRTNTTVEFALPNGEQVSIGPLDGLFLGDGMGQ